MELLDMPIWAIVPPVVTIVLAITIKEILVSMACGVVSGALLIGHFHPINSLNALMTIMAGTYNDAGEEISGILTTPSNCELLIMFIFAGMIIGLIINSGGSIALGEKLSKSINSKRKAGILTWVLGIVFLIDDYFNSLTNGTIMKGISDKNRLSRERLNYYIDATTVSVISMSPVSSWCVYFSSLIVAGMSVAGLDGNAYKMFLKSVPFNFYSIAMLIFVFCIAYFGISIGPMRKTDIRVAETGKLRNSNAEAGEDSEYAGITPHNGKPIDILLPVLVLVIGTLFFDLQTGGFFHNHDLMKTINNMDGTLALTYGFMLSCLFMFVYSRIKKYGDIFELMSATFIGIKSILYAMIAVALGWTLGTVSTELGIADFVISICEGSLPAMLLPAVLFLIGAGVTFAVNCWTNAAILLPVVIPLAVSTDADVIMCIGAVIASGCFGTMISPLCDTSIVSAMASEVSIMDHVITQVPYAVITGIIAVIGFLVAGVTGKLVIAFLVAIALLAIVVIILKTKFSDKNLGDTGQGQI